MTGKRNPGALAGATGAMVTVQAALLNVTITDSTTPDDLHHAMQQGRLRRRHGLSGPICAQVAALAFGRETRCTAEGKWRRKRGVRS